MKIMLDTAMVGSEIVDFYFCPDTGRITPGYREDVEYSHNDLSWESSNRLDNEHGGMWLWQGKPIAYKRGDAIYQIEQVSPQSDNKTNYIVAVMKTWLGTERDKKSCLWYEFYHDDEQIEWINIWQIGDKKDFCFEGKRVPYENGRDTIAEFKSTDYAAIEQFLAGMTVYRVTPPTRKKIDNWIETIR